jgi:hypothetical protein
VRVRFEGACVGCPLRPVTLSVTIEREISGVAGVASVSATGVQISPHAAARMRAAFAGHLKVGSPASKGAHDG